MNTENLKKWSRVFNNSTRDLLHFIYPNSCVICTREIVLQSLTICPICASELHYTYYEKYTEPTNLDKLFWGRIPLEGTYALFYFNEGTGVQKLLHALKYKNNPELGRFYGHQLGNVLKTMSAFEDVDAVVPVPLHPKKQFTRGYNQAEEIAKGVIEGLQVPLRSDLLKRRVFTESQTKRNRYARWDNMQNRFSLTPKNAELPKHLVIIDDVVTTGSTIEVLAKMIKETYPTIKISIATLAVAG
jgi:ComF family protein